MTLFTQFGPGDPETWGPVMDPRDPRFESDIEVHSQDSADEQARDEVLATPYSIAWWLNETVAETAPVKTFFREEEFFACDLSNGQLLAILLDCPDPGIVVETRAELRDRFLKHEETQRQIAERADELVGEPR